MAGSALDAAAAAVQRLRTAREQAGQRRAESRSAVEQLRERNREEVRELGERARNARRGTSTPAWPEVDPEPAELRLFEDEDDAPPAQPQQPSWRPTPPTPRAQPATRTPPASEADDDWSQESWLH